MARSDEGAPLRHRVDPDVGQSTMNCPACGVEPEEGVAFCTACGTKLPARRQSQEQPPQAPPIQALYSAQGVRSEPSGAPPDRPRTAAVPVHPPPQPNPNEPPVSAATFEDGGSPASGSAWTANDAPRSGSAAPVASQGLDHNDAALAHTEVGAVAPAPKRGARGVLVVVGTVLVLALVGAGALVATRQGKRDAPNDVASTSDTLRRSAVPKEDRESTAGSVVTAPPSLPTGGSGSTGTPGAISPAPGAATDPAVESDRAAGAPVAGGSLVYALESESDGYNPAKNRWGWSGLTVARALYDPLTAFDVEGVARPYLAESLTPSADLRTWTIRLRSGVRFHNGDPLTADSVKTALEMTKASALTGAALNLMTGIDVMSVDTLTVSMSAPWATFPALLTGQVGMVAAPSVYASPSGEAPVGSGPFVFAEWQVGKALKVNKNTSYWQAGKPYLTTIEFRMMFDVLQRTKALEGSVDLAQLAASVAIPAGSSVLTDATHSPERSTIALNTAVPPFDDQDARLAVAAGIDRGRFEPPAAASGYLSTGSPFFSGKPTATQTFDRGAAQAHAASYAKTAGKPLAFTISTASSAESQKEAQLVQSMMKDIGVDVRIEAKEQASLITSVVTGSYQAAVWKAFGGPSPELDALFIGSKTSPVGGISLNIPRFDDPAVADAFAKFRAVNDRGQQQAQIDVVQEQLASKAPWVFLHDAPRSVVARPGVHGAFAYDLPSGEHGFPTVATFLGNVWRSS